MKKKHSKAKKIHMKKKKSKLSFLIPHQK